MIKFSKLPEKARIWVYISNRLISADDKIIISELGTKFLSTWSAHGDKLLAAVDVIDDCILVIGVDENQTNASGCSVDASIKFLKNLESRLQISLLDWQNIAYFDNSKISFIKRNHIAEALKNGSISSKALIYNSNLTTKADLIILKTSPVTESDFYKSAKLKS